MTRVKSKQLKDIDDSIITRVEVIGKKGREFSKLLTDSVYEISIQDAGRTIKLFEETK